MFSILKQHRPVQTDNAAGKRRRSASQSPLFESGEEHFAQDIEAVERADPNWDDGLRIDDAVLRLERGMPFEQAVAVFGEDAADKAQLILRIRSGESFLLVEQPNDVGAYEAAEVSQRQSAGHESPIAARFYPGKFGAPPSPLASGRNSSESSVLPVEQTVAAYDKAVVEALFGLSNETSEGVKKLVEQNMQKLVEYNLQVAKAALGEVVDATRGVMSVKDAQELLALQATLLQPAAEKAASYSRYLYDIAAATQAEVAKVAAAQLADAQKNFASTVDAALKNAPAGSENAVALVKSAMAAANNAYESVSKAAKQASDVAEANFTAVTNSAVKATQAATKAKRA